MFQLVVNTVHLLNTVQLVVNTVQFTDLAKQAWALNESSPKPYLALAFNLALTLNPAALCVSAVLPVRPALPGTARGLCDWQDGIQARDMVQCADSVHHR
jgi:hypothetical protein